MNSKTQEHEGIQGIGWLAGTVGTVLLISAGLELLAHQVFGQTDIDTLLWALYLGFWTPSWASPASLFSQYGGLRIGDLFVRPGWP